MGVVQTLPSCEPIVTWNLDGDFIDSSVGCRALDLDAGPQLHLHGEDTTGLVFLKPFEPVSV